MFKTKSQLNKQLAAAMLAVVVLFTSVSPIYAQTSWPVDSAPINVNNDIPQNLDPDLLKQLKDIQAREQGEEPEQPTAPSLEQNKEPSGGTVIKLWKLSLPVSKIKGFFQNASSAVRNIFSQPAPTYVTNNNQKYILNRNQYTLNNVKQETNNNYITQRAPDYKFVGENGAEVAYDSKTRTVKISAPAASTTQYITLETKISQLEVGREQLAELSRQYDNLASQIAALKLLPPPTSSGTTVITQAPLKAGDHISIVDGVISASVPTIDRGYVFGQSSVWTDSTTNPSIWLNKTGASGDLIKMQVDGVDKFVVDHDGNVNIASTNLNGQLNILQAVNGQTLIEAQRVTDAAPSGDFITYYNAAGDTELFRVDNSGNIYAGGISNSGAVTITSTSTPQLRIQYNGTNENTVSTSNQGVTTYGFNGATPRAVFVPQSNRTDTFEFQNASGSPVVTVNTATPGLNVAGNVQTGGLTRLDGSGNLTNINSIAGSGALTITPASGSGLSVNLSTTGDFTVNSNQLYVDTSTGNVGISETAPDARLEISNNAADAAMLQISRTDVTKGLRLTNYNGTNSSFQLQTSNDLAAWATLLAFDPVNGRIGVGDATPAAAFTVGAGDLFQVNSSGAITAVAGITNTGGITSSGGPVSLNASSNFAVNIATGTSSGAVSIGGGSNTVAVNSSDWDISTTGVLTGISGITTDGGYTQSGTSANAFSGASSFTAAGTGLSVTNNTSIGGTLTVNNTGNAVTPLQVNQGAIPALRLISDSGTSARLILRDNSDANKVILDTAGNSYFDGGNVGIGDISPTNKLDVTGAIGISDTTVIDASRNLVNIGTISSGLINGQTISSSANFTGTITVATSISTPSITTASGALNVTPAAGFNLNLNLSTTGDFAVNTDQLYVDTSAGNVGIGTIAPEVDLHVKTSDSTFEVESTGVSVDAQIALGTDDDRDWIIKSEADDDSIRFRTQDGTATDVFTILQNGNVGIGITGPTHILELPAATTVAGGIGFGTDTELYRSAANILSLGSGDSFAIGGTQVINSGRTFRAADGSASTVAYGFANDTNTGMYYGGSDILRLVTNGANRLSIDASGNVAIGVDTPLSKLHVSGGTRITDLAGVGNRCVYADANGVLQVANDFCGLAASSGDDLGNHTATQNIHLNNFWLSNDGGSEGIRVNDTGQVGIGTSSFSEQLTVAGNAVLIKSGTADAITQHPSYELKLQASSWDTTLNAGAGGESVNNIRLKAFGESGAGAFYRLGVLNQAGTELLTVKESGNVGIGATNPETKLDVQGGDILLDNNRGLYIEDSTGVNQKAVFLTSGNQMQIGNFVGGATADLELYAGGSDRLHIEGDGDIGIGTTTPASLLHISSATADAVITLEADTDNDVETDNPRIELRQDGGAVNGAVGLTDAPGAEYASSLANSFYLGTTSDFPVQLIQADAAVLTIDTDGDVGIGDTTPTNKLDVTGAIGISDTTVIDASRNLVNIGTITSGLINGQTISSAANFTGTATVASTLTANGTLDANGIFTLGDNGDTGAIDTSDWDISTTGVLTGISGITTDGAYTQSGTGANTFTGSSSFTAAGTALSVTNNATIGGTLTSGLINGQTISSAANFTGTLNIATSATTPVINLTASANGATIISATDPDIQIIALSNDDITGVNAIYINDAGAGEGVNFHNAANIFVIDDATDDNLEIQSDNHIHLNPTGNVGISDASPLALFTVGSGDLFQVNSSGAIAAATGITNTGAVTTTGGVVNLNASSNFAINIATGTSTGAVSIGGGSNTVAVNSSDWDISTAGALSGVSGITTDGAYTQSGTGANTFTGASSFTAAGTALSVTNNATIGGTLNVTGGTTITGGMIMPAGTTNTFATNMKQVFGNWGSNNAVSGATTDKWIKVSEFTLNGAFNAFRMLVEGGGRTAGGGTEGSPFELHVQARNGNTGLEPETPTVWLQQLTTNNRSVKDVRLVRRSGTGSTNNLYEVWVQFGTNWQDSFPVEIKYWGTGSLGFLATDPQAQADSITAGFVSEHAVNSYAFVQERLAIGSSSFAPTRMLHVHEATASTDVFMQISNASSGVTSTDGLQIGLFGTGANSQIWNYENGYIRFGTNNTERWQITATGVLQSNGAQTIQSSSGNLTLQANGTSSLILDTTGAGTVTVGQTATTINVATSATATTIGIGNTTGATALNMNVGTGNFTLNGVAGSTYTIGAATTTGTITIGGTAQTGALTVGQSSGTNTINLGTGTGATTVNVATGATNAKTINIGTGAVANTIAIGSASTTGLSLTDNNWSITAAGAITGTSLNLGSGTITSGLINGQTISSAANFTGTVAVATSLSAPLINTSSGALNITPAAGSNLNVNLSTTGDFAVNTNQLYVDTSAGNVGIGTTTPATKLHIAGPVVAEGGSYTGRFTTPDTVTDAGFVMDFGDYLYAETTGSDIRRIIGLNATSDLEIGQSGTVLIDQVNIRAGSAGYIALIPGGGETMRITSDMKVGIGQTVPAAKLNIDGGGLLLGNGTTRNEFYVSERVDRAATDNASADVWYKFATIPATGSGNGPTLKISFTGGRYRFDDKHILDIVVSTRDGFEAHVANAVVGNSVNDAGIEIYQEADSSYSLYIKLTGNEFSTGQVVVQDGSYATGATFIDIIDGSPSNTTTPSGTLVFDTTSTAAYTGLVYDYMDERIGIGTTTPRASYKLDVQGSIVTSDGTDQGIISFRDDRDDCRIFEDNHVLEAECATGIRVDVDSNGNALGSGFEVYANATQIASIGVTGNLQADGTGSFGGTVSAPFFSATGASAGVQFQNRTGSEMWQWYATGNIARLYNGTIDTIQIDSSGNLTNVGTIASGLINGQTISSAANFTGTATVASTLTANGTLDANGIFTLGDNGDTGAIDTSDWDISTTGVLTGISGITTDGAYTQSGTGANTFTGSSSFTAAGTALSVTNNATIGGTLTSGLINGQTISSTANFTGTLTTANALTVTAGGIQSGSPTAVATIATGDILAGDSTMTFQFDASANAQFYQQGTANTDGFDLAFRKSRGTTASPSVITTGDDLALLRGYGYAAGAFREAARITLDSTGTIDDVGGIVPGILRFYTANNAGTITERLSISNTGLATFTNAGDGTGVLIDQNGNQIGLSIDKDVTNVDNTTTGITLTNTSVVNDAGTYTKSGSAFTITNSVTETSGTITDTSVTLSINQNHVDATGNTVFLNSDATAAIALNIDAENTTQDAVNIDTTATTAFGLDVVASSLTSGSAGRFYSNSADTSARSVLQVVNDNASASGAVALRIQQDSTADIINVFDATTEVFTILDGGNVGIGDTTPTNKLDVTGAIGISDTTVIDASRNLVNIGTITSGLINGQTVSSAANFTGTLTTAGTATFAAGTTGTATIYNSAGAGEGAEIRLRANNGTDYYIQNFGGVLRGINNGRAAGIWQFDQSGNLTLGASGTATLTSGLINGQTISSAANFTGTATFAGAVTLTTQATTTAHAVRADRTITSGNGLTGGGNLTADRTLAVGAGSCITVNADDVAVTSGCVNATTLDSIDSGSFLRSDATDSYTAGFQLRYPVAAGQTMNTGTGNLGSLEVFQPNAGADAFMTFHVSGDHAAYFGIDGATNDLSFGGWSQGANKYRVWHANNDGSGSGLDADLWDGNNFASYLNQAVLTSSSPQFVTLTLTGDLHADTINTRVTNDPLEINYRTAGAVRICATVSCGTVSAQFNTDGSVDMDGLGASGKLRLTGGGGDSGSGLFLNGNDMSIWGKTTGGVTERMMMLGSDNNLYVRAPASQSVKFRLGSSDHVVISSAGNVSAVSFSGSGSGLTGTASSLSIGGSAATATTATTANAVSFNGGLTTGASVNFGDLTVIDTIHAGGNISTDACFVGGGISCSDLAESFPVFESVEAGDILSIGTQPEIRQTEGSFALVKATPNSSLAGIVSTAPAILIEGQRTVVGGSPIVSSYAAGEKAPLALEGRVPVKFSLENGPILAGDFLTVSTSEPGKAAKAVSAGIVIGQALVDSDSTIDGKIMVLVARFWWSPANEVQPVLATVQGTESFANIGDINVSGYKWVDKLVVTEDLVVQKSLAVVEDVKIKRDLYVGGKLYIENKSFAGSLVTGADGTVDLMFDQSLPVQPVVNLTPITGGAPIFAAISDFIKEGNNFTGVKFSAFNIGGTPAADIRVNYLVAIPGADAHQPEAIIPAVVAEPSETEGVVPDDTETTTSTETTTTETTATTEETGSNEAASSTEPVLESSTTTTTTETTTFADPATAPVVEEAPPSL